MERVKNVYKITAKTENKTELEKYIFSHTPDNAAKKMRVHLEKMGEKCVGIMHVEQILQNVLYQPLTFEVFMVNLKEPKEPPQQTHGCT